MRASSAISLRSELPSSGGGEARTDRRESRTGDGDQVCRAVMLLPWRQCARSLGILTCAVAPALRAGAPSQGPAAPLGTATAAGGQSLSAGRETYANPLVDADCPDPGGIALAGDVHTYCMVCTSGNAPDPFPIRVSQDLVHWSAAGTIFSAKTRPAWSTGDFWAPELHQVGARYVAYFTARDRTDHLVIGAALADTPLGLYRDIGEPLLRDEHVGLIDPSYFRDDDGSAYLLWKKDGNAQTPPEETTIYVQSLSDDGIRLTGERVGAFANTRAWEGPLVEAPQMIKRGHFYYIVYSANAYATAAYAVGVARARAPFGPWEKYPEPILRSNEAWRGPGHGSVVAGREGDWFVYHAWAGSKMGEPHPRKVLLDRMVWGADGWPRLGDGTPSTALLAAP